MHKNSTKTFEKCQFTQKHSFKCPDKWLASFNLLTNDIENLFITANVQQKINLKFGTWVDQILLGYSRPAINFRLLQPFDDSLFLDVMGIWKVDMCELV